MGFKSRRRSRRVIALTLAAFSLAACSDGPSGPAEGRIEGRVTLEGGPAFGLIVTADFDDPSRPSSTTTTDAEGDYAFQVDGDTESLEVTVSVAPPPDVGCDPADARITFNGGFGGTADFTCFGLTVEQILLSPEGVSLLAHQGGVVTFDATVLNASGTPISTADVLWELVEPAPDILELPGRDPNFAGPRQFAVSDETPAGEYVVRVRAGGLTATGVIQVVEIAGDVFYSAGPSTVRQLYLDRLVDSEPAEQVFDNPSGNILHLAVDQLTGTLFFAQGVGAGSLIMAVPLDGEEPLLFTTNPNFLNQTPAIDQNTGRLYFSRLFGGSTDIYGVNQNGTGLLRVTTPGGGRKLWPAISPDGTRIAWSQDLGEGNTEIFTATTTGAAVQRFTFYSGADIAPHWISNDRLAWTRDILEGNAEIMAADWPLGRNQEIVSLDETGALRPGNQREPGRSCRPGSLLVISDHEGTAETYMVDDGSGDSGLRSWVKVASAEAPIASAAMRCR